MAIEISGLPTAQVQESSGARITQALQNDIKNLQQDSTNASPTDHVTLTKTAAKLQKLEKDLSNVPEVDQDRIASLRKAIASGEYKVDPVKTAEKLVRFESALAK